MAEDIASIGLRVDTSQLEKGKVALDSFAASGNRAEKSTSDLERAAKRSGVEIDRNNGQVKSITSSASAMADAQYRAAAGTQSVERSLSPLSGALGSVHVKTIAVTAALAGLAAAARASGSEWVDYSTKIAEVSTLVDATPAQLERNSAALRRLSQDLGKSAAELAAAEYDVVSAGASLADAPAIVEQAAKAATAGVTDTKTAAGVGISVLNAYGLSVDKLGSVYDTLFATVRSGVTTFPELASTIGQVLPIARAANVDLAELGAVIATMTKAGIKTPEAMTAIRGAIVALSAPGPEAKRQMDALGISWKGLAATVGDIAKLNLGVDAVRKIIPDVQAATAVLAMSNNIGELNSQMGSFRDVSGAMPGAYAKIAETPAQRIKEFDAALGELRLQIGEFLAQGTPIVSFLGDAIRQFNDAPAPVHEFVRSLGLGIAGMAAWRLGLGSIVERIAALTPALASGASAWEKFGSAATTALKALVIPAAVVTGIETVKAFSEWMDARQSASGAGARIQAGFVSAQLLPLIEQAKQAGVDMRAIERQFEVTLAERGTGNFVAGPRADFRTQVDVANALRRALAAIPAEAEQAAAALVKIAPEAPTITFDASKQDAALQAIIDRALPAQAAVRRLWEDVAVLDEAAARGAITQEEYARALAGLTGQADAASAKIKDLATAQKDKSLLESAPSLYQEAWKNALGGVQSGFASFYSTILTTGRVTFNNLASAFQGAMVNAVSQVAAQQTIMLAGQAPAVGGGAMAASAVNPWALGAMVGGSLLLGGLIGDANAGPSPYQVAQQQTVQAVTADIMRMEQGEKDLTDVVNAHLNAVTKAKAETIGFVQAEEELRKAVNARYDAEKQRLSELNTLYADLGGQVTSLRGQISADTANLTGQAPTLGGLRAQISGISIGAAPSLPTQSVTAAQADLARAQADNLAVIGSFNAQIQALSTQINDAGHTRKQELRDRRAAVIEQRAIAELEQQAIIDAATANLGAVKSAWAAYNQAVAGDLEAKGQQIRQLSSLRDATLSWAQAQGQLMQTMLASADRAGAAIKSIQFAALTSPQQSQALAGEFQALSARASGATGEDLAAISDQLAQIGPQLIQSYQQTFGAGSGQAKAVQNQVVAALSAVEQQLRISAPTDYQQVAAGLLGQIDGKLADLGQVFSDGQGEVAAQIAALNADTTSILRAIAKAMGAPGYAKGLDYVPFDNYPATLHFGEAVLTKEEADLWRSGLQLSTAQPAPEAPPRLVAASDNGDKNRAIVDELRALRSEVANLRKEAQAGQIAIATNTQKSAKILDRWDGQGMPDLRTV